MNKRIALILAVFFIAVIGGAVYASDVTNADYMTKITISNNNTTAQTNKVATFTLSTADMIAADMLNASANDCAMRTGLSGTDIIFMPSVNSTYPWCTFVDSIGASTSLFHYLFSKDVTGGDIAWFPGAAGGNITDNASFEFGGDGAVSLTGTLIDTSVNSTLFEKPDAISLYTNESGNITAQLGPTEKENFTTYTEVDAGGYITETSNNVSATNVPTNADCYLYKDYGVSYFDGLDVYFTLYNANIGANGYGGIGITNTLNDVGGYAATDLSVLAINAGATWGIYLVRGNFTASDISVVLPSDTPYYCHLVRAAGNDTTNCTIYSDSSCTVLVDTLSINGVGAATKWRYSMGFVNVNNGLAGRVFNGFVSDLSFGMPTIYITYAAATSDYNDITVSVNGTSSDFEMWLDGLKVANTPLGSVSLINNSNNWTIGEDITYIRGIDFYNAGVHVEHFEWRNSLTFAGTINGTILTPSFRTTSSDNISGSVTSSEGLYEGTIPLVETGAGWTMITAVPVAPSGMFTDGGVGFPLGPQISTAAVDAGDEPEQWIILFAFALAIFVFVLVYGVTHSTRLGQKGSLILSAICAEIVLVYFYIVGGISGLSLIPAGLILIFLIFWRKSSAPVD